MFKNSTKFVVVLFLLWVVSACDRDPKQQVHLPERVISLEDIRLKITPGDIPVETLLTMTFESQTPVSKITAELRGVNMYMGRIPVRFIQNAESGLWQAELMLGACSDPNMTWRLTLILTDAQDQTRQLATEFQSSWR